MAGVPSPAQLGEVAVEAARAAGAILVDTLGRVGDVGTKQDRTWLVTSSDLAAQAAVERVIADRFPGHTIRGEEGNAGADDAEYVWLVDPLDGTSNFARGVPMACTSVAVTDGDGVVAGAVFEPFRGEMFTATRGGGAWLGDERLEVSKTDDVGHALVGTGVQSDDDAIVAAFGTRIAALARRCRAVRCFGVPALSLAYVAAGRIDAFCEEGAPMAWDVAAGALLIAEAGGRIESLDGRRPINLGAGFSDVLASNGLIHDELAEIVRLQQ